MFLKKPPCFELEDFPVPVYRLDKEMYGLKQAPRTWYNIFFTNVVGNGYKIGAIDSTLFFKRSAIDLNLA